MTATEHRANPAPAFGCWAARVAAAAAQHAEDYDDPNVPCGRTPEVRWIFINSNPGHAGKGIYGWLPEKDPTASQPQRARPADSGAGKG